MTGLEKDSKRAKHRKAVIKVETFFQGLSPDRFLKALRHD
jgi:hypothetical protein